MTLTQIRTISNFYGTEYCNYASYDNLRKIASLVDGQKNASRKILWFTLLKNLTNEVKVSQLNSKVAEELEYLHGDMSGVIVNLAKNYIGTNNINLMQPEGNFGTLMIPEASAPRYIFTNGSPEFFDIFSKEDSEILEHQEFEGTFIEPKFLMPKLPILLVNGAEGITSGFKQKILPRDPEAIVKYIKYYLKKPQAPKKPFQNKPYFKGFKGTVEQGDTNTQWLISGTFTRKANKVHITELPVGYSLKSYTKVLDKLEDSKIIIGFDDNSNVEFDFVVQFNRKVLDSLSDEKLISILKLQKKVTENFTVMDQFNVVQQVQGIDDIMQKYFAVKLDYTQKRKDNIIKNITQNIKVLVSKYMFIRNIVDEVLVITKRPTKDIISDLDNLDKIIKVDDSYNYLLNMSIQSLTEERMQKLLKQIKDDKSILDATKKLTIQEMWLEDLK